MALATHSEPTNTICLSDGVGPWGGKTYLPEERKNITTNGFEGPFKLWAYAWASARVVSELAKIVIEEKLGINVYHNFMEQGSWETRNYALALMTCERTGHLESLPWDWEGGTPTCKPGEEGEETYHAALEFWSGYAATVPKYIEGRAPVEAGEVGYRGDEGLYLRKETRDRIWEQHAVDFQWYSAWQGPNANTFFDDTSVFTPPPSCEAIENDLFPGIKLHTEAEQDAIRLYCSNGWYANAPCEACNRTCCTPFVHTTAVPSLDFLKSFGVQGIPVLFGLWSWGEYVSLTYSNDVPFYWYTPDATFIDLEPVRITLPPYNKDEWDDGVYGTDAAQNNLLNFYVHNLRDIDPQLEKVISFLSVSKASMDSMLLDYQQDYNYHAEAVDAVTRASCNWLRANPSRWESWVPEPIRCGVDGDVAHPERAPADCPPLRCGSGQFYRTDLRRCDQCRVNTYKEGTDDKIQCDACPRYMVAPLEGAVQCELVECGLAGDLSHPRVNDEFNPGCPALECPPGYRYDADNGLCVKCSIDYFKAGTNGRTFCDACPKFSTTENIDGVAAATGCRCERGYVGTIVSLVSVCYACPDAVLLDGECPGGELMTVPEGYFKSAGPLGPDDQIIISPRGRSGRNNEYCLSTVVGVVNGTECGFGSTGPLCGACTDDYMISSKGQCLDCESNNVGLNVASILGMQILFACFVMLEAAVTFASGQQRYKLRKRISLVSGSVRTSWAGMSFSMSSNKSTSSIAAADAAASKPKGTADSVAKHLQGSVDMEEGPSDEAIDKIIDTAIKEGALKPPNGAITEGLDDLPPVDKAKRRYSDTNFASDLKISPVSKWDVMAAWKDFKSTGKHSIVLFSPLLRIALNYLQIWGLLSFVRDSVRGSRVAGVFATISIAELLDFNMFVDFFENIDCSIGQSLWEKKMIAMVIPFGLCLWLLFVMLVWKIFTPAVGLGELTRAVSFSTMILYSSLVKNLLNVVDWIDMPEPDGKRYVKIDTSVEYNVGGHTTLVIVVAIYLALYAICVPMTIISRYHFLGKRDKDKAQRIYGFLVKGYRHEVYWWELTVILRRLCCIIAAVFLDSTQISTIIAVVLLISVILHVYTAPYSNPFLNIMEFCSLVSLIFCTIGAHMAADATGLLETGAIVYIISCLAYIVLLLAAFITIMRNLLSVMLAAGAIGSACPAFCITWFKTFLGMG